MEKSVVFRAGLRRFFWWFALPGGLLGGWCLYLLWWLFKVWPAALEGRLGVALPLIIVVTTIFGSIGYVAWAHGGLEYEAHPQGLLVKQRGSKMRFLWERLICTRSHRSSWRARLRLSDGEKEHLVERFFLPEFETLERSSTYLGSSLILFFHRRSACAIEPSFCWLWR